MQCWHEVWEGDTAVGLTMWVEAIREDGLAREDPQGLGIKARSAGTKPSEN